MRPYSQRYAFQRRDLLIQGDSVRQIWGVDAPGEQEKPRPLRRDPPVRQAPSPPNEDVLHIRLGEELDYVRRLLDIMGDQLSGDPILLHRHSVALQSIDRMGQILGHVGRVIRSSEPNAAVEEIGMSDLKARLTRS